MAVAEDRVPVRYLLIWFMDAQINQGWVADVRRRLEDDVREPREDVEIDVWLESPGGDANAAYKLALMLRSVAGKVRIVVPDYAKSAATLLSVAGDEIYLAPAAELGPLDVQMPDEGSLTGTMSALSIARAADELSRDAVGLALSGGAELLRMTGLSRAKTLEAMLVFSAAISEPMLRQIDPNLVHHAKQNLKLTAAYAKRLLLDTGNRHGAEIARKMVETFPTHGFVIGFDEARELGLPVLPLDSYDLLEHVRPLHRMHEDGAGVGQPVFGKMSDFIDEMKDDETESGEESEDGAGSDGQEEFVDLLQHSGPNGANEPSDAEGVVSRG